MFDEFAYHKMRILVVIEKTKNQRFCYCWPLSTYDGQAGTKKCVLQSEHTIAYAGERPPEKLAGEVLMTKDPIKFVTRGNRDLPRELRINMGIEYPIQPGARVSDEGHVHGSSMRKLLEYRNHIRTRASKKNAREWGPLGPGSYNPLTDDDRRD